MKAEKLRLKFAAYAALDAVNVSSLLQLKKSPRHYRWYLEHGREDTDTFRQGRAFHTASLEPMEFMREYLLWDDGARRGGKWDAFKAEADELGKTVLTKHQYETAEAMAASVRDHETARHYINQRGEREVTILWTHERTGLRLKARVDWLCEAICDFKSTSFIDGFGFGRSAASLGYHIRAAFYTDAVRALTDTWRPSVFICCESSAPHDVAVRTVPQQAIDRGRILYGELLIKLVHCRETGRWPGVAEDEEDVQFPEWTYGSGSAGLGLTMGGAAFAFDDE